LRPLFTVRSFLGYAFFPRKAILEKLIRGKNACYNEHRHHIDDHSFLAEVLLVLHWFKDAYPSLNSKARYQEYGDLPHQEQQISVAKETAEYFSSYSVGNWVRRLQDDVTRGGNNENT